MTKFTRILKKHVSISSLLYPIHFPTWAMNIFQSPPTKFQNHSRQIAIKDYRLITYPIFSLLDPHVVYVCHVK